jgi:uncharacterized membrane protein
MIKKHWKLLVITSLVILLPIAAGLILWNQLPEQMPSHWNAAGEIDAWSSKPFSVFGMPLILLAFHWLCVIATGTDPKKTNHSDKIIHLVFWILPVLSVVLHAITYLAALGKEVAVETVMPVLLGLLFAVIGNYLPKCKQSYTVGIKIPWTLNSEENWNKTHRLAGRLWLICGIAMMLTGFLVSYWICIGITLVMVAVPVAYSYILYRKGI